MPVRPHVHHEIDLSTGPEAPRLARAALDGWFDGSLSEPAAEDIRLATTELVTNAVRHAGLGPRDSIRLTVHQLGDVIRVEVGQPGSVTGVRLVAASERPSSGGYGLALVDAVADRWGVEVGPPGCVWFEVAPAEG